MTGDRVRAPLRRLGDRLEAELDGVATSDAWLPFSRAARDLLATESLPAEERERVRCKLVSVYVAARDALVALFRERAPLNAQQRGEGLEQFLLHVIFGDRIPCPPIATLFPGDPVRMSRSARKRWALDMVDFVNSLEVRGVPGRKKGQPKPEKSGRRTLDPALAAQAYRLHRDGKSAMQIARALLPKDLPRTAAKKRVGRLLDFGERLFYRKIVSSAKKPAR